MSGLPYDLKHDTSELIEATLQIRKHQKSKDLCFGVSKELRDFKREAFSYHFKDEPNYQSLRLILEELRDEEKQMKLLSKLKQ